MAKRVQPVPTTARRLRLFGSLYFAQGATLSYFLTFNVLYLREHGFAASDIGYFQAVLVLPFILKILLGVISDRFSLFGLGHRLPYMVAGLAMQALAFAALPQLALPAALDAFFALALCAAVGMAMYDTATDGLAIEITPARERSLVQGVMVGARASGILVALLLGAWLVDRSSWTAVFYLVVALTLPALVLTLGSRGLDSGAPGAPFSWRALRGLGRAEVLKLAAIGVLYASALDGLLAFVSYHPDAGGVIDVGLVSGLVALSMAGRIVGAVLNSLLTARLGYRRSLGGAVILSALVCAGLSVAGGTVYLAVACALFGLAYGYYTAVYSALAMALADPRIAASMFAVFMMFLNLGVALGQALGGSIVEAAGFVTLAWVMAAVVLIALLFLPRSGASRAA